ncbi:MAG: DCC1-like thiol-disulfide oxidoreductase family protein [Woeseiaceae bacterium]
MTGHEDIELVYDTQCPLCDFYCRRIDVTEASGRLVRVDARDEPKVMDEITALGLDIDEGMVVKSKGRIHYGSDAIHELALMSSRKGFVNRLAWLAFRSRTVSRVLYPMFRAVRNGLLKILGRSRINNLNQSNNDWF